MINFVSVKCPECNSDLSIEEGRNTAFCTYCGAKVLINNENEHIYRYIDDAGIKKAETERIVQLRKMELIEKQKEKDEKKIKNKIIASIILFIIGFIALQFDNIIVFFIIMPIMIVIPYMWLPEFVKLNNQNNTIEFDSNDGKAKIPSSIDIYTYKKKNYQTIETIFRNAGFTNIQSLPIKDLKPKHAEKQDMVIQITINGERIDNINSNTKTPKDANILISYHSL